MVLELHLPAGLQQVPNPLPEQVCPESGPQAPSWLTAGPVGVGVGLVVVAVRKVSFMSFLGCLWGGGGGMGRG